MIFPPECPSTKFDFLSTWAGSSNLFQEEIKKSLGYAARSENRITNALIMKMRDLKASGIRPTTGRLFPARPTTFLNGTNMTLSSLANGLELLLKVPVVDQTGFEKRYDIQLDLSGQSGRTEEKISKAVLEQWGMELVPTNTLIEFWVVEKI